MKDFLASTEIFHSLGAEDLEDIKKELEPLRLSGGEFLFREGDAADCLYLVKSGRLRVEMRREGGSERKIGEVGRGEVVGELALLVKGARSASVLAIRDSELLRLSETGFERLLEKHPHTMMSLARRIVIRDREALRGTSKSDVPSTIAVVPIGRDVALSDFADKLHAALSAAGTTLRLDSARLDRELGPGASRTPWDHPDHGRIIDWLHRQEDIHGFILYVADPGSSPWTECALRQADRVLLVGRADRAPETGGLDLSRAHGLKELVLVHHERRRQFTGTLRWLSAYPGARHHHLQLDSATDFGRLVRFITGRAVGLVLGGGGARGFAHIGVIRAIEEAGIPIDIVGGTSMGSFIGAQYALGLDWRAMRDFNRDFWNKVKPYSDLTFPWLSLVRGRKYLTAARAVFGDSQIEDLWLNYFCVASDLTRARITAPTQGSLLRWVGASMAIPGIVAPVFERGDLYVDGGVLDNLPIDVMLGRCEGVLIAVDVTPREDLAADPLLTASPGAWSILWSRLSPWASKQLKVPTIFDILSRVTSLSSLQTLETVKKNVDLYLNPPTEEYGILEFDCIDEIIEIGYRHALEKLKDIEHLGLSVKGPSSRAEAPMPAPEKRARRSAAWARRTAAVVLAGVVWHFLPSLIDRSLNRVRASPPASKRAQELIKTIPITDLHADSLLWDRPLLNHNHHGHVDIPRLIRGHAALQVFSIVTQMPMRLSASNDGSTDWIYWLSWASRWPWDTHASRAERALYQARRLRYFAEQSKEKFLLIRSAMDLRDYLERRKRDPKIAAGLLAVEGAQALEGNLNNLDEFYEAGVRMMSPAHFVDTEIGGSAHGVRKGGLTPLGRQWLSEMEERKMIVDVAHASPRTIADVLTRAKRPIVVSHTGVRATCDNRRNLSDEKLRGVARNGGLIGIGYWPAAVCGTDAAAVARAIRHAVDVAGISHVALGSDFDGAVVTPFDSAHLDVLADALLREKFSEDEVRAIMGGNALDFFARNLP